MKKLYSFGLFLMMLLFTGLTTSAVTSTFEWEIPGSVKIKTGSLGADFIDLGDQTSYTFETSSTFGYVYVFAADGYIINSIASTDGEKSFSYSAYSKCYSCTMNSSADGKTFKVDCVKLERNDSFTIDIVNGADALNAEFESGYKLDLQNGQHTYAFNPSIDKTLTISPIGVNELYTITLNGQPVEKNPYFARYDQINIQPGDNLTIRVYEVEPAICNATLDYAPGLEGCLNNIRNITTNSFIMPDDIVNNSFTVKEGTSLQLNLNYEDYNITKVLVNGEEVTVTPSYDNKTASAKVTITETENTIRIEGTPKTFANIDFTGYIINAEGLEISETYGGDAIALPEGTKLSEPKTVAGYTFDTEYVIPISEKLGKFFFRPKAGYYIADLYTGTPLEQQGGSASINANSDGTVFYMVIEKMADEYTALLNIVGSQNRVSVKGSSTLSNSWDNPASPSYNFSVGENTLNFIPGYNTPIVVSMSHDVSKKAVYLDGVAVKGTENSDAGTDDYLIEPYVPADASALQAHSTITVYADNTEGKLTGASLTLENGATAEFFYSNVRRVANPAGQTVLEGTVMIVKPANPEKAVVTYKGAPVSLDENGEYVFTPTGSARQNVVTVSEVAAPAPTFDMSVDPANGTTVKTFNTINVELPMLESGNMPYPVMETLTGVNVTKNGAVVATIAELGEPGQTPNDTFLFPLVLSEAITEAGTYTINIPEGAFAESAWDDAAGDFAPVAGGAKSAVYSGTVTVDPNLVSKVEVYTFEPASGSALRSIESITLRFTEMSAQDMFENYEFPYAFLESETGDFYDCYVSYAWDGNEHQSVKIVPVNEDDEDVVITEKGKWTLTLPEGAFEFEGMSSPEITAEFFVDPTNPAYAITPVHGSTTDDLSVFTITFSGVDEVEYNDAPITLVGPNYDVTSLEVTGVNNVYTIRFNNPTENGEYTLSIPAGAFTLDGNPSEATEAKYTFKRSWELTPAPGSVVESLNEFVLTFPEATAVEFVGESYSMLLTNGFSYASPALICTKDEAAAVPTFVITLPEDAQQPPVGNYTLHVDEAAFIVDGKPLSEINAEYTLMKEASSEFSVTPENGIIIANEWYSWAVIFDETTTVRVADASKIHVYFDNKELAADADYMYMAEGNMFMFMNMNNEYCKDGELHLVLEAGALMLGTTASPVVDTTWNVVAPKTYTYTITPADGTTVNKFDTFTITFPEAATGTTWEYTVNNLELKQGYSASGAEFTVEAVEGAECATFVITVENAPTTDGEYTFTAREGAFVLDGGQSSPEIAAVFTLDSSLQGIGSIGVDTTNGVTVVTVDGKVLFKDAPAEKLDELSTGVYIVNGVKVFIQK